jgi:hypothetical protein
MIRGKYFHITKFGVVLNEWQNVYGSSENSYKNDANNRFGQESEIELSE